MTKADEGVAPTARDAVHIGTASCTTASVGVADVTHTYVRDQLSEYLDDNVGETTRRRIDGHLASCRPCAADLDTLRLTVRALGQLPAPKAPARARTSIVEQARHEHAASSADA